jgi:hypothetical protein
MESTEREDGDTEKLERRSMTTPAVHDLKDEDVKATRVLEACKWKDLETIRILAESEGGLVSDEVRRHACRCYQDGTMDFN